MNNNDNNELFGIYNSNLNTDRISIFNIQNTIFNNNNNGIIFKIIEDDATFLYNTYPDEQQIIILII